MISGGRSDVLVARARLASVVVFWFMTFAIAAGGVRYVHRFPIGIDMASQFRVSGVPGRLPDLSYGS